VIHGRERPGEGLQTSTTAGGKWRWQCKKELDGEEWSVTGASTRHTDKSTTSSAQLNKYFISSKL